MGETSTRWIERRWQGRDAWTPWLRALSFVFSWISALRRMLYRVGLLQVHRFPVPVIVVGNITVGGSGKSPLVIWLARYLKARGWRPGLVSRGYGGGASRWPQQVREDSDPAAVGDEAVMLASATGCPMSVGPDRPAAVMALLEHKQVDLVIADDGLQHYALGRDLEIAVIDGRRRFGNGLLLPAGPLREPPERLQAVDAIVINGGDETGDHGEMPFAVDAFDMRLGNARVSGLHDGAAATLEEFAGKSVHAIAGIGHPERFFSMLRTHGIDVIAHPFPDHHAYKADDLRFDQPLPLLMTEKDAVKCRRLRSEDAWVVRVEAQPDAALGDRLEEALKEAADGQKAARHPGLPDL